MSEEHPRRRGPGPRLLNLADMSILQHLRRHQPSSPGLKVEVFPCAILATRAKLAGNWFFQRGHGGYMRTQGLQDSCRKRRLRC